MNLAPKGSFRPSQAPNGPRVLTHIVRREMVFCDGCDRSFWSARTFEQHPHNSNANRRVCRRHNKAFTSASGLIQHYIRHPCHHYCQRCDDHFDCPKDLDRHYEELHYYCQICNWLFDSAAGLYEHHLQKHWYCADCRRVFESENNLTIHLRSAVHRDGLVSCPGGNCNKRFMSAAALVQHWESGTCPSRVHPDLIGRFAVVHLYRADVNPYDILFSPDTVTATGWATQRSCNGQYYECPLCHEEYITLRALNQHLEGPAHAEEIYRCPRVWNGCGNEFGTLSALCQHIESRQCGVHRFSSDTQRLLGWYNDGHNRVTIVGSPTDLYDQ
ncbi:uncharacterized protein LAESUDRAFT_378178 [Laetiporus sulphureus 93-53]|uniref:C2H2-type domain-containing protein n=1 Tax=Laetiporus sulphureus 93-53 TaxID=1314785 RepID=A0A165CQ33_9APHY|nr:uncharacterized protein LAESUDRAFT_378178 [Laetiporus sulphureus 93-53]KZT03214.1 hypothetical protein LAESUDRAFT_378178 [Laetiporus sulphureus 93-53]